MASLTTRTFAMVHNIPSPYRLHLFRVLEQRLRLRGHSFFVHFMAETHCDRPHWRADPAELTFPHAFHVDVGPRRGDKEWHLNPGLLTSLLRDRPDVLMVGGPWDTLTTALLTTVARLIARKRIAWIEGNVHSPGRVDRTSRAIKTAMLSQFDAIAAPGKGGADYTRLLIGETHIPIANLPNLVDETCFTAENTDPSERSLLREELRVPANERLAIWNARLVPAKGVPEFLKRLVPSDLDGWQLRIFGEGPQREQVLEAIELRGLAARVSLVNYWPYARMPALYRAADLMLLPSVDDPNPLSVVEALHTGLPLLVSHRIGNHAEAIREGENGWTVDPFDDTSVRRGIEAAFRSDGETLCRMGNVSKQLARATWSSREAVDRFLDEIGVTVQ